MAYRAEMSYLDKSMAKYNFETKAERWKKRSLVALFAAVFIVVPFLTFSSHKAKLYVDADASSSNANGSSGHPYKTISKAISKADGKTEIHVANGTYKENITLEKDIEIFGESQSGVVIKAKDGDDSVVIMNDDTKINKVTIKGGRNGIKVKKNTKVSIIKVTIKDNDRDGIYIEEADVKDKKMVSISKSLIKDNGWSGIYSKKRRLSIMDSEIRENGGDGADIEAGSSAWLESNKFNDNAGTGLKLRIDGSNIWTKDNTMRNNEKEGMEISFSGLAGRINIDKVKIVDNHRYGIARIQRTNWKNNNAGLWNSYLTYGKKNYFFENRLSDTSPVIFIR